MPQYNSYPVATTIAAADLILFWNTASSINKIISFQDLAEAVNDFLPKVDDVSIISSNTTLDSTFEFVVGNSGGSFTITLPSAVSNPGLRFRVANKGAGDITMARTGGDVIAGAGSVGATSTISQYEAFDFESDGVNTWFSL